MPECCTQMQTESSELNAARCRSCRCQCHTLAAKNNPTPLSWAGKKMMLQNSHSERFLCSSSGDGACSPLLPSALLCPGSWERPTSSQCSQGCLRPWCLIKSPLPGPAASWHSLPCKCLPQLLPAPVLRPRVLLQHHRNIKGGKEEK